MKYCLEDEAKAEVETVEEKMMIMKKMIMNLRSYGMYADDRKVRREK